MVTIVLLHDHETKYSHGDEMSLESQALVWAHSKADGATLLALLAIADHDGDGGSWPSMDTIAHRARVTRDHARKLVRRLEDMGEIVTDTNGGGGLRTAHHMRTNRYEITIECPPTCDHSARHRELPEPVDNTPQPNGCPPAARLGTPQPHGGAKHPINTLDKQDLNELGDNRASAREEKNDYSTWKPGAAVARATAAVHGKPPRQAVQPAPRLPRLIDQAPTPPPLPPQPPEQQALNEQAARLPCPDGFGDGKNARHWIPPTLTGCARCGTEAAQIIAIAHQLPQETS